MVSGYKPLKIAGNTTGLVQSREEFILPADAYPTLENAYVWRERILRKGAYQLLGRLRRSFIDVSLGNSGASIWTFTIYSTLAAPISPVGNAEIQPGSVIIKIGGITFTDQGNGTLTSATPGNSGTILYQSGVVALTHTAGAGVATTITFAYYPNLPVMGIRQRDLSPINNEMTVFFDTTFAYNFTASGFVEFIPGTTWSGSLTQADSNFFWTTNYWQSDAFIKLFWATNFSGTGGDPIRYTNGTGSGSGAWEDFAPEVNATADKLNQCLALLPFRGRLVAFNTLEGANLVASKPYTNRIRWAAIGNPITIASTIVTTVNVNAWRDDIRGQGGFLDIPTNEDIIAVGFVRDNLVIYCENSTWQLRYTGRSIAPFQIEKVNSELGSGSTFSAVQFDKSLIGIGDKGVVECDSYQSQLIDIKIPDLVMNHINNKNFGQKRVHGVRNYLQRLAYWTYPESDNNGTFPDRRLMYNYENDSWAIFTDSLTTLGLFQPTSSRTWANPSGGNPQIKVQWQEANFPWVSQPALILSVIGGNQQGFVEYLDEQTTNDESLTITAITGNTTSSTQITSPKHNLQTGAVLKITSIPTGTPFATSLNTKVFGIVVNSVDTFLLNKYSTSTGQFSDSQLDAPGAYVGGGQICVRDNFSIRSKKFNFLDEGQNIQIGYIDILMNTSVSGAISLNVYEDYDDNQSTNNLPSNKSPVTGQPDTFFNITIPTSISALGTANTSKANQRVFCPSRANYITLEYTFSNAQMAGVEQENDVQIDMQVLWQRPAGRLGNI